MNNEIVWLTLDQTVNFFERDKFWISWLIKNIFTEGELNVLNRILSALNQISMKMEDWGQNSNDFFKMTKKEILAQKGTKFLWWNLKKAHEEYETFYA